MVQVLYTGVRYKYSQVGGKTRTNVVMKVKVVEGKVNRRFKINVEIKMLKAYSTKFYRQTLLGHLKLGK